MTVLEEGRRLSVKGEGELVYISPRGLPITNDAKQTYLSFAEIARSAVGGAVHAQRAREQE